MVLTSNRIRNLPSLAALAVFSFWCSAVTTRAEVVAHWRFEPGALTVDSSGNGHTLLNAGVTEGAASPADGSTGSARFNGANIMSTVETLDLSSYDRVRVTWWQQIEDPFGEILFEHSADMNANKGAFFATANMQNQAGAETGRSAVTLRLDADAGNERYNSDFLFHENTNIWEKVAVEFTITPETEAIDVVRIYKNDVFQEGTQRPFANYPNVAPFIDDTFYIGARAAIGDGAVAFPLLGNLDEMMIEGFITDTGSLAGDYNEDGIVDAADYVMWRKNDGTNNALANDDGLSTPIGPAHYDLWKANFGNESAGSMQLEVVGAVPEPNTMFLAIACLLLFGVVRRCPC